jgi:hypothetical protein
LNQTDPKATFANLVIDISQFQTVALKYELKEKI